MDYKNLSYLFLRSALRSEQGSLSPYYEFSLFLVAKIIELERQNEDYKNQILRLAAENPLEGTPHPFQADLDAGKPKDKDRTAGENPVGRDGYDWRKEMNKEFYRRIFGEEPQK